VNNVDDWGSDPSVRKMRRIFSDMELAQKKLIKQLRVSHLDARLRDARENAKNLFEKIWYHTELQDLNLNDDNGAASIYIYCLAWALNNVGIVVSEEYFPDDNQLRDIIKGILS